MNQVQRPLLLLTAIIKINGGVVKQVQLHLKTITITITFFITMDFNLWNA